MTPSDIKNKIMQVIGDYPIKKVLLFGSRAAGTNKSDSDVDLIMEFSAPITLLTLSAIKIRLEELLGLPVDVIHGPIRDGDFIDVNAVVELYAA